jgi:homogentisate 1,2-dioxygenase
MLHRIQRGQVPRKPHIVFKPEGELAYEHCFTREGFEGLYTIMYHRKPPHWVESDKDLGVHKGWAELKWDGPLRRRHFLSGDVKGGGSPFSGRKLMIGNSDVRMWVARPDKSDDTLIMNASGDEMTYVFKGSGELESPLGILTFKEGDYVYVPRGMPHRFMVNDPETFFFIMEGNDRVDIPSNYRTQFGQLRMDAPYTHRDFQVPEWPEGGMVDRNAPRTLLQLRGNRVTKTVYANDPFDLYGWDGQVYPYVFPILNFQPKTGLVHLPPTIHISFSGPGFVICSFIPRKTDFHPEAIPCPYPHSSPSCDEILFYVSGNFTSRKGVGPGSISLHPIGIAHGPHPGTYEASIGTHETSELAVMIDTAQPLLTTKYATGVEDEGYNLSWVK